MRNCKPKQEIDSAEKSAKVFLLLGLEFFLKFNLVDSLDIAMSKKVLIDVRRNQSRNGILLPKLFRPTVRKNCFCDHEKLLKFEAKG